MHNDTCQVVFSQTNSNPFSECALLKQLLSSLYGNCVYKNKPHTIQKIKDSLIMRHEIYQCVTNL